ncbi:hypothetical protein R50345_22730 [Paenibacillus sp. FSL R5-0345]|uniref:hypothetical protein n=1 Tax=Paenibacillus sp. FSL R5-0345 TaxID=1536770 RepID=UPI0004F73231|nr:hypothetical protein [Paenibacillus sp. FSL R5-0345]AIQ37203.1 hypothetical protein R50345_22730 [Paenibacillus sp. FSL R5-0345]
MEKLLKLLEEMHVDIDSFCEKLGMSFEEVAAAANASHDAYTELGLLYASVINDEQHLYPKLLEFFSPYVSDKEEIAAFITQVLRLRQNFIPRRMLNSIERLVTLADDTEIIRPGKHSLKIFYFVVCIETLYSLVGSHLKKYEIIIDFFNSYIPEPDKQLILKGFRRNLSDDKFNVYRQPEETYEEHVARLKGPTVDSTFNTLVTMEIFARVINELRNCFAHEGDYWKFHFAESDHTVMNSLIVAENKEEFLQVKNGADPTHFRRVYSVDLSYEQFKGACVRGFIEIARSHLQAT